MADHEPDDISSYLKDRDNDGTTVDAASYLAASVFGSVVVPLGLSFAKAAAIDMQANFALQLEGAENFSKLSGGPIDQRLSAARDEDADKTQSVLLSVLLDENERQQEREREEWARKESSIGGVTMTGAQWSDMAKRLRTDEELQRKLIEMFKARGMSEADAVKRVERVADVSEAMGVPPSHRTEEQREIVRQAKADPTFEQDMRHAVAVSQQSPSAVTHSGFNAEFERAAQGSEQPDSGQPGTNVPMTPSTKSPVHAVNPNGFSI